MTGKDQGEFLVLKSSDAGLELRMAEELVRSIAADVMRGFAVTKRRGAEVGGLLIGSTRKGVLQVDSCEVVPCEYAYGPSYLLSDNDGRAFAEAAARWAPGPGRDRYAVGVFRSHTRDGLLHDAADLELLQKFFDSTPAALLLVKPYATRAPEGALFLYGSNHEISPRPAVQFALEVQGVHAPRQAPARSSASRVVPPPEAPRQPTPPPVVPVSEPPQPAPAAPKPEIAQRELFAAYTAEEASPIGRILAWSFYIACVLLCGFVGGYVAAGGELKTLLPGGKPPAPPDPYALGLRATPRGDSVLLEWNRQSALLNKASKAAVVVIAPSIYREVPVSIDELRRGYVLFKSDAPEGSLRIEIYVAPDRLIAERVVWKNPTPPSDSGRPASPGGQP